MLRALRPRLTYANVVATLALFIALGGSSYAVSKIAGTRHQEAQPDRAGIQDELDRRQGDQGVEPARRFPARSNAARLGGQPAARFLVSCPQGSPRRSRRRRLRRDPGPPARVLRQRRLRLRADRQPGTRRPAAADPSGADGGARAAADPARARGRADQRGLPLEQRRAQLDVLYITEENGSVGLIPDDAAGAKSFRCVADPMN